MALDITGSLAWYGSLGYLVGILIYGSVGSVLSRDAAHSLTSALSRFSVRSADISPLFNHGSLDRISALLMHG